MQTDPRDAVHRASHLGTQNVDAECCSLATVVGRTKLTTLATVDVTWRILLKSRVYQNFPEGSGVENGGGARRYCIPKDPGPL